MTVKLQLAYNDQTGAGHVHKPGCNHTNRQAYITGGWEQEVSTMKELVDAFWGPNAGSFYEECWLDPETAWETYMEGNVIIAPCAKQLTEGLK
jgi:hypothetical protein